MDLTICGESGLLDDKYHFVEDRGGWIITSFGQSTYVVRIRSSLLRNDRSHGYWDVGFIESDQLVVTEYVFDDIWPDLPSSTAGILGKVLFTENIATRLLEDF